MAEPDTLTTGRFNFGKREHAAMGAVHFDLTGVIHRFDTERLASSIDEQLAKGVRRFLFHLALLSHMHKEMVGRLFDLHQRISADHGIIILVGAPADSLEMLRMTLQEHVPELFQFADDEKSARQLLAQHIASTNPADEVKAV